MFYLVECEIQHKTETCEEIGDIYLVRCVFTIWEKRRKQHCKFTYNNAHTLIWHRLNSQLFTYLISHFHSTFCAESFIFILFTKFPHFLFTQWWFARFSPARCASFLRTKDGTFSFKQKNERKHVENDSDVKWKIRFYYSLTFRFASLLENTNKNLKLCSNIVNNFDNVSGSDFLCAHFHSAAYNCLVSAIFSWIKSDSKYFCY